MKLTSHSFGPRRSFLQIVCLSLLLLLTNISIFAATFTVTKTADTNDGVCDTDCSLREAIVADLWNKYAWRVEPQELIFLPGVESGFNMALKALVQPQQNVVVQVPNYPPLRHAPGHWGLNKVAPKSSLSFV